MKLDTRFNLKSKFNTNHQEHQLGQQGNAQKPNTGFWTTINQEKYFPLSDSFPSHLKRKKEKENPEMEPQENDSASFQREHVHLLPPTPLPDKGSKFGSF